jgi:hypothetical protein
MRFLKHALQFGSRGISTRGSPRPFALVTYTARVKSGPVSQIKAMDRPSGDHVGESGAALALSQSTRSPVPSAFTT